MEVPPNKVLADFSQFCQLVLTPLHVPISCAGWKACVFGAGGTNDRGRDKTDEDTRPQVCHHEAAGRKECESIA